MVGSRRKFLQGAALAVAVVSALAEGEATDEAQRVREMFARRHGLPVEWVGIYSGAADALHYAVLAFTSPTRGLVGQGEAVKRAASVSGARMEAGAEAEGAGMVYLQADAEELERVMRVKASSAVVVVEGAPQMREGLVVIVRIVAGCAMVVGRPDLLARIAAFGSGVVEGAGIVAARRRLEATSA